MTVSFIKRVMTSEYISHLRLEFTWAISSSTRIVTALLLIMFDVMMLINMYEGALITCGCYDAVGTARSLGLTSMRERAELTGGKFTIESTPGEGATIRVSWPIEVEDQLQNGRVTL